MFFVLAFVTFLAKVQADYEFNATSPLPPVVMARGANMSKPRLLLHHPTEFEGMFGLVINLGIQMALEGVAKTAEHLKDFEIQVNLIETYCDDAVLVKESMKFFTTSDEKLPILPTLGCTYHSERMIGETTQHYDVLSFAIIDALLESYSERERFHSFYTIGESTATVHAALVDFMHAQGWKRVAMIGEDHTFYIPVCLHNFTLFYIQKFPRFSMRKS